MAQQSVAAAADTAARADNRTPYLMALAATLVVFAGYVFTLAPTVTFWDAAEFIASAHILGIPHPPGTPLFVLLGRVADMLLPFQHTAAKTNLMTAVFSACAAGFLFLFMYQALVRGAKGMDELGARIFRVGGAFAATLAASFAFTVWQNSIETEVYMLAVLAIGVVAWLCWLWRRDRGGKRGAHELLLMVYVLGMALSNHLMGLLVGPAVIGFMYHVLRTEPAKDPAERQVQWSQLAVIASLWVTMVGVGIGKTGVIVLGLLLYAIAAVWAHRAGSLFFAVAALAAAAVGVSGYLYLYIRAGLHPYVNEADPSTWNNLVAVIRRDQYPPRSPLDNPIYQSGPDNPGRTMQIFLLQLLNYVQYFDWQWSASLQTARTLLAPARVPFTVLFIALGTYGALSHRKWDRSSFWFLATLFLTTSIGLIVYLNFKPGFSLAREAFPELDMHEVRERDYFYTISFLCWGLWAGLGIATAYRALRERLRDRPAAFAAPVLLIALLPFMLNFRAASRRHGPEAEFARDFAYDMLQSAEPYGILITAGDNDTFPLWYIQEAEGVRQDVVNVITSLANTDWFIRQLRDNPARPFRPDSAARRLYGRGPATVPACSPQQVEALNEYARRAGRRPPDLSRGTPACIHTMSDEQIAALQPQLLPRDLVLRVGNVTHTYAAGSPLYVSDIVVLRIIQENLGKRPIYFALSAGSGARMGLDAYLVQQGLAFKLMTDSARPGPRHLPGPLGGLLDMDRTRDLLWGTFRFARLLEADTLRLDPTNQSPAANLFYVFVGLAGGYEQLGRRDSALTNYRAAYRLVPSPQLRQYLQTLEAALTNPALPGADTARADSAAGGNAGRR